MTIGASVESAAPEAEEGADHTRAAARRAMRYGLSALGPVAVSGAHFVASLIFLHALSRSEFGLFSFLLVVVPFCLSLSGSLLGVSITSLGARSAQAKGDEIGTHLKANLVFAGAAAAAIAALLAAIRTPAALALLLGLYGGAMTLRWFARSYAYAMHTPFRVAGSDFSYAVLVIAPLIALVSLHELTAFRAAVVLTAGALIALVPFGRDYIGRQLRPGSQGSLAAYAPVWRNMTRWSLLGVVLTEMTANAHAYLVTLIAGPGAFALLAVGALLMRPVSLVYAALPDLERPAMARAIGAGDFARAFQIVKEFRRAVSAVWLATIVVAGAVLIFVPHIILKKGYSADQAMIVAAIFAIIMAARAIRTPESVLLQAAHEFRPLARASLWSSIVSLAMTLILLLLGGPVASLGGILAGEGLLTANILTLSRNWRRSRG